ncbi:MAG: succinylglutamate desuccinylase/aspartoacylase family protein [Bacteroidota bacterium]
MNTILTTKIALLLLAILLVETAQAQNNFTHAFGSDDRPSRENIRVEIEDDQNNQSYIPISIIRGKEEGPVFTLVSGVHGFEYPPIVAAQELTQEIRTDQLMGTFIIIPIANMPSFFGRSPFVNPQDKINLNRTFPGSPTGSITERIAHFITTDIIPVSDVFLDIHGGDAGEDLIPFVCYYNNEQNPEETQLAKRLSEISGFEYVVSYSYTLQDNEPAKYAFKQAVQDGKTALSLEGGKLGNVQREDVDLIKQGVYNMLAEMNMYSNTVATEHTIVRLDNQAYVRAQEQGIFYSNLKAGDTVEEGEIVGYVKDEFGEVISTLTAPNSGIILYKIGTPPVNIDETIMCIAYE